MVLLAVTCGLSGCTPLAGDGAGAGSAVPWEPPLPLIRNLRPRLPIEKSADVLDGGPEVRARISQLVLPLRSRLTGAWALARARSVAPPTASLWSENGLVACVVHKSVLKDFFALIPQPLGTQQDLMRLSRLPTPLKVAGPTAGRQRITLVLPDDQKRELVLSQGSGRLLIQAQPQPDATVLLYVTPQYYRQRVTIRPRSVLKKQLDGHVFDELRLQARLAKDQVLLIGLAEPEPAASQPAASQPAEPEPAASQPATPEPAAPQPAASQPAPSEPAVPQPAEQIRPEVEPPVRRGPPRLGDVLLGASQGNSREQVLLAIVIEERR